MTHETVGVQGHLLLEVADGSGRVVHRCRGANTLLEGGRLMLARLLAGEAREPEFAMTLGGGDTDTSPTMRGLAKESAIRPVAVKKARTKEAVVILQASFPVAEAEETIAEAGLTVTYKTGLTTVTELYNRVRVQPALKLKAGETLSATWELSFSPISAVKEG